MKKNLAGICLTVIFGLIITACGARETPRPDYSVISSPEIPILATSTPTPEPPTPTPPPAEVVAPQPELGDDGLSLFEMAPATAVVSELLNAPTEEPTADTEADSPAEDAEEAADPESAEESPTATPKPPTATPKPATPPDAPRQGGSWDMEDGFEVWVNPYGDNCSGSKVATGWKGFTSRGQYGSSCFYLNDFGPNVFSGGFSQQVTFDFTDSHAGLLRIIETQPGHTYQVTARIRHVHTLPPMQFHFGVDLTGGASWEAETVAWSAWDEFREDDWITHEETFTADGNATTIYIKGFHDTASQGGATYIDGIEVIDLG